jgi:ferrochelatase
VTTVRYDAFLLVSFGGPERPEDVQPFLANVTRGRGVPPERLAEVAEHYLSFGGVSPINAQCRELLAALENELDLPLYWGNRNWHPLLHDTLLRMHHDGVRRAIAFVTSPYGSYSSCRQYLEDIAAARSALGPEAPVVDKIRHYHDDPGFVAPFVDSTRAALSTVDPGRRATTRLVFTAHSIPTSMALTAGPQSAGRYEAQLRETAALVAAGAAPDLPFDLVWQSRSGPPQVPWLEPDVNDHLATLARDGTTSVVAVPIGFVSDHLEVVWDLDTEAAATAKALGLDYVRAATPGTDPRFVGMIRRLVDERRNDTPPQDRLGRIDVWNACPADCCPPPRRSR